jgi:hypothetical protein
MFVSDPTTCISSKPLPVYQDKRGKKVKGKTLLENSDTWTEQVKTGKKGKRDRKGRGEYLLEDSGARTEQDKGRGKLKKNKRRRGKYLLEDSGTGATIPVGSPSVIKTPYPTCRSRTDKQGCASEKEWDPIFFTERRIFTDEPFVESIRMTTHERQIFTDEPLVESRRIMNDERDGISIFLRDFDSDMASVQIDSVEAFCRNANLEDLISGTGSGGYLRTSWLDDRSTVGSGGIRKYSNPLTATSLYRSLKRPVCLRTPFVTVERRLIELLLACPWFT